jgi:uncharacterized protein YutE (UPF0331/DUF86 family)
MVTISPAMTVALEILSERSALPVATQATAVLRAALDRTIHSAECQDRLRAKTAFRTRYEWLADRYADVEAETALQALEEQSDAIPQEPATGWGTAVAAGRRTKRRTGPLPALADASGQTEG